MATGIVRDDGMRHAMAAQFKCRQRGALIARSGFIDPDMHRQSRIMRHINGRQRRAPIDTGEPACVAMGKDIDGLAGFRSGCIPQQN